MSNEVFENYSSAANAAAEKINAIASIAVEAKSTAEAVGLLVIGKHSSGAFNTRNYTGEEIYNYFVGGKTLMIEPGNAGSSPIRVLEVKKIFKNGQPTAIEVYYCYDGKITSTMIQWDSNELADHHDDVNYGKLYKFDPYTGANMPNGLGVGFVRSLTDNIDIANWRGIYIGCLTPFQNFVHYVTGYEFSKSIKLYGETTNKVVKIHHRKSDNWRVCPLDKNELPAVGGADEIPDGDNPIGGADEDALTEDANNFVALKQLLVFIFVMIGNQLGGAQLSFRKLFKNTFGMFRKAKTEALDKLSVGVNSDKKFWDNDYIKLDKSWFALAADGLNDLFGLESSINGEWIENLLKFNKDFLSVINSFNSQLLERLKKFGDILFGNGNVFEKAWNALYGLLGFENKRFTREDIWKGFSGFFNTFFKLELSWLRPILGLSKNTDEFVDEVKAVFDTNGDGKINIEDFFAIFHTKTGEIFNVDTTWIKNLMTKVNGDFFNELLNNLGNGFEGIRSLFKIEWKGNTAIERIGELFQGFLVNPLETKNLFNFVKEDNTIKKWKTLFSWFNITQVDFNATSLFGKFKSLINSIFETEIDSGWSSLVQLFNLQVTGTSALEKFKDFGNSVLGLGLTASDTGLNLINKMFGADITWLNSINNNWKNLIQKSNAGWSDLLTAINGKANTLQASFTNFLEALGLDNDRTSIANILEDLLGIQSNWVTAITTTYTQSASGFMEFLRHIFNLTPDWTTSNSGNTNIGNFIRWLMGGKNSSGIGWAGFYNMFISIFSPSSSGMEAFTNFIHHFCGVKQYGDWIKEAGNSLKSRWDYLNAFLMNKIGK